jgi:hypothetical protein
MMPSAQMSMSHDAGMGGLVPTHARLQPTKGTTVC